MTTSVDKTIRDLDGVEVLASRDMLAAAPSGLRQSLGLEAREIGGATLLIAPGLPSPQFNRVVGVGNERLATEEELDAIAECYRSLGVKDWWIQVSPGSNSEPTLGQLAARGFVAPERKAWAKMIRGAEPTVPVETGWHPIARSSGPSLRISRVASSPRSRSWSSGFSGGSSFSGGGGSSGGGGASGSW